MNKQYLVSNLEAIFQVHNAVVDGSRFNVLFEAVLQHLSFFSAQSLPPILLLRF